MANYLVIVESPTKEKTISKMLGGEYAVKSSYGHIRDLPKSQMGVDIEHGFIPKYVSMPKAKKVIAELKKFGDDATAVYLATDYDREGEAIAWHLKESMKLPGEKVRRITFHEITAEAIREALAQPRSIDMDLVNSQQARRVLDRLVGYKLSPLLWRKVKYGLSAGRVQSVAVRLICDREEEIERFKPQEYWTLAAELKKTAGEFSPFLATLAAKGAVKFDKFDLKHRPSVDEIIADLDGASYRVAAVERKERRRSPFPPYTTSTLQQDASRRIGFSAARTMKVAQRLYEGISLDGSEAGLITYMRTDSLNIAESARREARRYVETKLGARFLPPTPRVYKTKARGAQEAHEAIRPTSADRTPDSIKKHLSADEFKLYDLIWRRFLASQMSDAVYDTISADIAAKEYVFRAAGRTLKFPGFLEVYLADAGEDEKEGTLPPLAKGEGLDLLRLLPEQHFTEPPPRYNEASLIKALEEHGIGRPSTYAPIIDTILGRTYVRLDQRRFFPTNLGRLVNDILKKHFTNIVDVEFTAAVEEKLDLVAEGKTDWANVVSEFYRPLEHDLASAEKNLVRQKVEPQKTNEICPHCGKPMVLRDSRRGQFLACTGFPECRTTFSIDRQGNKIVRPAPELTTEKCEKCGRPMFKRIGKRGPFLACSGFPKCRNIRKIIEKNEAAADKDMQKE